MVLLAQDSFLTELTRLFQSTRESGSLSLTLKRVSETKDETTCHRCLVRARTEKKKISTVVEAANLLKFQTSMCNILKVHMTNLKRKERSKDKKPKSDEAKA
ncbi:hypothetical protein CTAYLR_008973 [Chrysophaeum taylorii]|uniref:Signal recognition particle 14 kDa protein n=1 Tax=Chrysophaeum taylorii TaxID=2483200 RepID=A0AAD7UL69_9STRA|nr:hypothetical protein CTAYLR_008973 [Chrysophaeum taylorii]